MHSVCPLLYIDTDSCGYATAAIHASPGEAQRLNQLKGDITLSDRI